MEKLNSGIATSEIVDTVNGLIDDNALHWTNVQDLQAQITALADRVTTLE